MKSATLSFIRLIAHRSGPCGGVSLSPHASAVVNHQDEDALIVDFVGDHVRGELNAFQTGPASWTTSSEIDGRKALNALLCLVFEAA
jgi:hypothetical protein